MTVDDLLAAGRYTDRRGRRWTRSNYGVWMHPVAFHPVLGVRSETRQLSEMRLLIERDMHRDECAGLRNCYDHPVPFVETFRHLRQPHRVDYQLVDTKINPNLNRGVYGTIAEAIDAAYVKGGGE